MVRIEYKWQIFTTKVICFKQRRASKMKRHYYWTEIKETPFTLVVTYPELYGQYRLQTRSEEEIHRVNAKGTNVLNFFSGSNWKIHPDWCDCETINLINVLIDESLQQVVLQTQQWNVLIAWSWIALFLRAYETTGMEMATEPKSSSAWTFEHL